MTDLTELREDILAAREQAQRSGSALAALSADGLAIAFDRMAPPGMRILEAEQVTLTITPHRPPFGLDAARLIEHFTRAIASIGVEVVEPSASLRKLTPADYARTQIRYSAPPGGPVTLSADTTGVIMGGLEATGRTVAQAAMERLVNLLPARPDEPASTERLLASRAPTARAAREVALAARRVGGIEVTLRGEAETVEGYLDPDQGRDIVRQLETFKDQAYPPRSVAAIWDGMRYSRREFFLVVGDGALEGLVDERLVPLVRGMASGPVVATIQDVVRIYAGGRIGHPVHHLVDIRPDNTLDLQNAREGSPRG